MSWDKIEGQWKRVTGEIKEEWGKLTERDLTAIDGKKDQLVGKIQEEYGIAKDEAERQVNEFAETHFSKDQTKAVKKGYQRA
jgi:uncharacterized protein YjbJ (UPF0337 family)